MFWNHGMRIKFFCPFQFLEFEAFIHIIYQCIFEKSLKKKEYEGMSV